MTLVIFRSSTIKNVTMNGFLYPMKGILSLVFMPLRNFAAEIKRYANNLNAKDL